MPWSVCITFLSPFIHQHVLSCFHTLAVTNNPSLDMALHLTIFYSLNTHRIIISTLKLPLPLPEVEKMILNISWEKFQVR